MPDTIKEIISATTLNGQEAATYTTDANTKALVKNIYVTNPLESTLKVSVSVGDTDVYSDVAVSGNATTKFVDENLVVDSSSNFKVTNSTDTFLSSVLTDTDYVVRESYLGFFRDDPVGSRLMTEEYGSGFHMFELDDGSFVNSVSDQQQYMTNQVLQFDSDQQGKSVGTKYVGGSAGYEIYTTYWDGSTISNTEYVNDTDQPQMDSMDFTWVGSGQQYMMIFAGSENQGKGGQLRLAYFSTRNQTSPTHYTIENQASDVRYYDNRICYLKTNTLGSPFESTSVAVAYRIPTASNYVIRTAIYKRYNADLQLASFDIAATDPSQGNDIYSLFDVDDAHYGILWRDKLVNGDEPVVYSKIDKLTGSYTNTTLYANRSTAFADPSAPYFAALNHRSNKAYVYENGDIGLIAQGIYGTGPNSYRLLKFNDTGVVSDAVMGTANDGFRSKGMSILDENNVLIHKSDGFFHKFDERTGITVKVDGVEIT